MSQHLVLLGDSILDNARYISRRHPAVIDQVRCRLPHGWSATLLAIDGSVIEDVHKQLEELPADTSHLALSVGGNDVLNQITILQERVPTVGDALRVLLESRAQFQEDYHRLMEAIRDRGLPTAVCTIYNPCSDRRSLPACGGRGALPLQRRHHRPCSPLRAPRHRPPRRLFGDRRLCQSYRALGGRRREDRGCDLPADRESRFREESDRTLSVTAPIRRAASSGGAVSLGR